VLVSDSEQNRPQMVLPDRSFLSAIAGVDATGEEDEALGEPGTSQREQVAVDDQLRPIKLICGQPHQVGDQQRPSAAAAASAPEAEAAGPSAAASAAEQGSAADKRKGRRNAFELMLQVRSS
jgi:hypothetical protein